MSTLTECTVKGVALSEMFQRSVCFVCVNHWKVEKCFGTVLNLEEMSL